MQRPTVVEAAEQGMVDVVRHLCELPQGEPGAVTQWMKNAAMELAAQNGHSTVVRYLCELPLDRGVDPSLANNKAIESAASINAIKGSLLPTGFFKVLWPPL